MKTKNFKSIFILIGIVSMFIIAYGQDVKPWIVPEKAKAMKNPVEATKANIEIGKALFKKHCKSCHGDTGLGDGAKSETLKTFPGDFSSPEFKAQTDGELYYKTSEGRDEMPSFKTKIPDNEDRWNLISYMRTLK